MFDPGVVLPETARWAPRTIRGDRIVVTCVCAERVRGADCECRWLVTGRMDPTIDFIFGAVFTVFSRRRDDNNAGIHQATNGQTQRIIFERLDSGYAQTYIH